MPNPPRDSGQAGKAGRTVARRAKFVGACVVLVFLILHLTGAIDPLEGWLIDRRAHWTASLSPEPTDQIVHVDIDDGALKTIGRWPWHREELAYAIDAMRLAGARTILLDILLTSPQEPRWRKDMMGFTRVDDDAILARSLREAGNVLLACAIDSRDDEEGGYRLEAKLPIEPLLDVAAGVGFVDAGVGGEGVVVRDLPVTIDVEGRRYTQLGIQGVSHFLGAKIEATDDALTIGSCSVPLRDGQFLVPWRPRTEAEIRARIEEAESGGRPFTRVDGKPQAWHHIHDRIPITALVQVGQTLSEYASLRRRAASVILNTTIDGPITDEIIARVDDEVDFQLPDIDPDAESLDTYAQAILAWGTLRTPEDNPAVVEARGVLERLRERLEGKLAIVGWTAEGAIADFYPTALGGRTPGAMVHSAVANGLLTHHWPHRVPAWVDFVFTLAMGTLGLAIGLAIKPERSWIAFLLAIGVYFACNVWWWFGVMDSVVALAAPSLAGAVAWVVVSVIRAIEDRRERERVMRQFRARVSTRLVDYLTANPEKMNMEGEERELTMCFTDLAGFTSLSEKLGGRGTVRVLNRCLSDLTEAMLDHHAYVNKFLGDGIMAFWGAPLEDEHQANHAVKALRECYVALDAINARHAEEGLPPLGLRAGIATGVVIVGDCGAPPTLNDYTVIGDSVNLAARLESANKQLGTKALVNERTRERLSDETLCEVLLRPLGRIRVVGQERPTRIFELVGASEDDDVRAWIHRTEGAVEAFEAGRVEESKVLWGEVARTERGRKGAELYLRVCERILGGELEHDGVLTLESK